ncbi:hypothetical protein TNCV_1195071 [Trichonephila clavipes]|nr:hypothetical protein TNCV_1195071 [Trichonephila clavipes]
MKDERWKNRNMQYKRRRIHLLFITYDDPSIEQKRCAAFHSRRESISGESLAPFPEDTFIPYSGFEPESTRLQAEVRIHNIGLAALRYFA